MKYNEIIDKIKKFKIDVEYGKIEFDNDNPFDHDEKFEIAMEPFIKDLMSADDLSITHNEFSSTENLSNLCENMKRIELEELIIKKKVFLDTLKNESYNLIYHPVSKKSSQLLAHQVSLFVVELEKVFNEREEKEQNPELTLTKKIALLKSIGFYDRILELDGSNAYKAKITQLLTGGSLDTITKNIKNLNLDIKDIDAKYTSYQHVEDMKKLVSKIKSETRGK
ncbi:hypothetical protein OAI68_00160 [Flavobacteriaceae bacterium]|nr:hypothetical protein [Flavobacteriaceae bacterium]